MSAGSRHETIRPSTHSPTRVNSGTSGVGESPGILRKDLREHSGDDVRETSASVSRVPSLHHFKLDSTRRVRVNDRLEETRVARKTGVDVVSAVSLRPPPPQLPLQTLPSAAPQPPLDPPDTRRRSATRRAESRRSSARSGSTSRLRPRSRIRHDQTAGGDDTRGRRAEV